MKVEYARFADDLVTLVDAHPRQAWLRKAVEKRLREELSKLQVEVNWGFRTMPINVPG